MSDKAKLEALLGKKTKGKRKDAAAAGSRSHESRKGAVKLLTCQPNFAICRATSEGQQTRAARSTARPKIWLQGAIVFSISSLTAAFAASDPGHCVAGHCGRRRHPSTPFVFLSSYCVFIVHWPLIRRCGALPATSRSASSLTLMCDYRLTTLQNCNVCFVFVSFRCCCSYSLIVLCVVVWCAAVFFSGQPWLIACMNETEKPSLVFADAATLARYPSFSAFCLHYFIFCSLLRDAETRACFRQAC